MKEAVVTDGVEAMGQGVLEVAADELALLDGDGLLAFGLAVLDGYQDRSVGFASYPGVGYGAFLQIGAQILDGVGSVSEGLDVAVPLHLPQRRGLSLRKEILLLQGLQQEGPHSRGEDLAAGQPPGLPGPLELAPGVDADGGDDAVDMWMQPQVLRPGLQDADEAAVAAEVSRLLERVFDGLGAGGEEGREEAFGFASTERPQSRGQGEGGQEVLHWKAFLQLVGDPVLGFARAAGGA